ncbi:hypothetical protein FOZ61_003554 [Perkinsus olseni]|uniref:Uncharacterized protein n=1 Tax=Perkinsus olseni TaxID=32597 RepID=A0A7J6MDX8_PEROL|nr:hypothetical protein FOZ61_003554 [Perkinsus olseni]
MSDGSGSSGPRRSSASKPGAEIGQRRDEKDIKFREQSDSNAKVLRYVTDFLMNHSGKWIGLDKLNHNPKLVGFIGHLLVGLPGIHRTMTVRATDGTEKEIGYLGTEWIAQTFNIRDWGGIPMVPREIITVTKDPAGEVLVKLTSNWTTTRTGSKLIVDPNAPQADAARGHGYHYGNYGRGGRGGYKGGGAWWKGGGGASSWKGGGGRHSKRQYNHGGYYGNGSDDQWWDQQYQGDNRLSSSSYRYGRRGADSDQDSRVKRECSPAVDWDDDTPPAKQGDESNGDVERGDPDPKRQRVKSPSVHRRASSRSRGKSATRSNSRRDRRRSRDRSRDGSMRRSSRRRSRGSTSLGRVKDEEDDYRGRSKSRAADRRGYPAPRSRSSSESSVELSDAESWPEDPTDDRENRNNNVVSTPAAAAEVPEALKQAKAIADDLQLFELGSERKQRDMRDMLREMIRDIYQIYRPEKSSHVHSRLFRKFSGREDLLYLLVADRYVGRPTYHERRRRRIKYRPKREEHKSVKPAVSASTSRSSSQTPTASQRNGVGREGSGLDATASSSSAAAVVEAENTVTTPLPPVLPLNIRVTPEIIKFLTRTRSWLQKAVDSLVPKIVLFDEANAHPLDIRVLHVLTNCCMIKFRPERAPHKVIGCLAGYERCIPTNLPQGKSVTNMSIPKTNALLLKIVMRDPSTGQITNGDLAFRAVSNEPATEEELEIGAANWQSISVTPIFLSEDDRAKVEAMRERLVQPEAAKHLQEYLAAEDISGQIVALRALAEAAPTDVQVFWLLHRQLRGMPTHPWRKHLARTCESMPVDGKNEVIAEWYNSVLVPESKALQAFLDDTPTPPIPSTAIEFIRQIELALEYPFTKSLYNDEIGLPANNAMEVLFGRYARRLGEAVGPSGEQSDWCLTTFRTYLQSILVLSTKSGKRPSKYLNVAEVCGSCLKIAQSIEAPPDVTTQAALVLAHGIDNARENEQLMDHVTSVDSSTSSALSLLDGALVIPPREDMPLSCRLALSRGLLVAAVDDATREKYTGRCVESYISLLLDRHAALDTPTLLYGLQSLMVLVSRGAEGPLMEPKRIRQLLEVCVTHWEHPSNLVHQLCEQLFEIECRKAGASSAAKLSIVQQSIKELPFCRAKCKGLSFLLPVSSDDDTMAIALDMVPDLLDTVSQEGSSSSAAKQLLERVCSMAPEAGKKFDLRERLFSPILALLNRIHQDEESDLHQGLADTLTNILAKAPAELLVSLWNAALSASCSADGTGGDYSVLALAGLFRKLGRAEFTETGLTLVEPKAKKKSHRHHASQEQSGAVQGTVGMGGREEYGSLPIETLERWILSSDSAMAISTLKLMSTVKSPATTPITTAEVRLVYPLFIRNGQQLKLSDLALRQRATSALKAFLQRLRDTWDMKSHQQDGPGLSSKRYAPWLKELFLDYLIPVATRPGSPLEIAYPAATIVEHVYKLFGSLPVSLNTGKVYTGCSIAQELGFYDSEVIMSLLQALGAAWSKQRTAVVQALQAVPPEVILQVGPQIDRRIAELARKSKQVVRVRWTSEAAALAALYSQALRGRDRVEYVDGIMEEVKREFKQSIGKGLDALRGLHVHLACLAAALPTIRGMASCASEGFSSVESVTSVEVMLSICVSVLGAISEGVDDVLVSSNLLTAVGLDHAAGRPKTSVDCRGHLIVSEEGSVESDEAMDTSDDVSMDIDDGTSTTTSAWTTIKESISALEAIVENLTSMESIAGAPAGGSSVSLVTLASPSAVEVWDKVGSMLLLFLLSTKHPGANTRLYRCLAEVTRRLLLSEDPQLQELPHKWLQDLHSLLVRDATVGEEDSEERSRLQMVLPPALRRSFGLGLCFVGILEGAANHLRLSGGGYTSCQMLLDTIARLQGVFEGPSAEDVTSCVHALNVLRAIVRDAHLAGYIPESVMNSILLLAVKTLSQRGEETWPIRSAGTLLFVHASRRVLGNDSEHTVASGHKHTGRATTLMELCRRQPQLIDAITALLRDRTVDDGSTVMPALLFVCKLKLGNEEALAKQQHKDLLSAIWELAKSPIWHVRKLASVALVNLGAVGSISDALRLQPHSANGMHVKLEVIRFLVKTGRTSGLRVGDIQALLRETSLCPPLNTIVLEIARLCQFKLGAGPCDAGDGFLGVQRSQAAAAVSTEPVENSCHPQVLQAFIENNHASEELVAKALSVDISAKPEYRGAVLAALTAASPELLTEAVVERLHTLFFPNDVDGVLALAKSRAESSHRKDWLELCSRSSQPAEVRVAVASLVPDTIAVALLQDECEEVRRIACKNLGGLAPLPTLYQRFSSDDPLRVPTASEVTSLIADRAAPRSFDKEEPNTYQEELLSTQLALKANTAASQPPEGVRAALGALVEGLVDFGWSLACDEFVFESAFALLGAAKGAFPELSGKFDRDEVPLCLRRLARPNTSLDRCLFLCPSTTTAVHCST